MILRKLVQAMIEIHEHMHDVWKQFKEEKPLQSGIFSWIDNLPFDRKVKEWLVGEERYKEEAKMEHILPAVADRFLLDDRRAECSGASILCFDEIQVFMKYTSSVAIFSLQKFDPFMVGSYIDEPSTYRNNEPTHSGTELVFPQRRQ